MSMKTLLPASLGVVRSLRPGCDSLRALHYRQIVPLFASLASGFPDAGCAFDGTRAGVLNDHSQFYKDLSLPFFGYKRPGAKISEGVRENFWYQGMQGGLKPEYDCIKAFSETDFTEDLRKIDIPTLVMHGDDDQIVPFRTLEPFRPSQSKMLTSRSTPTTRSEEERQALSHA